ncbi:MAG: hypothetical protein ACLFMX_05265 [Halobacteriales archaeon]
MSGQADPQEAIEVAEGGVTVTKSRLTDEFPVPTVGFEIASSRDEPVSITVTDRIPTGFTMDAIGFHAEYESDNWTAFEDGRIEFEREVAPEETVVTLYGVRTDDPTDIEEFMAPPSLAVGEDRPDAAPEAEAITADTDGGTTTEPAPAPQRAEAGAVAERLAEELRNGRVDEADRTAIREALGLDLSTSSEAQLRHLQTRVEDAIAYADPVERFLDAGGPERMEAVADEFEEVRHTVTDLRRAVEDLGDLEPEVATMREEVAEMEGLRGLEEDVAAMEDRLDELPEDLDEVVADQLDSELETVRTQLRAIHADLDDLERSVETINHWREQLMQLFGDNE